MSWLTQNWVWIVFSIGVVLLLRRSGCMGGMGRSHQGQGDAGGDHADQGPTATTTATDPVTGKDVAIASATTSVYQGRVYYFETPESRQRFEASPQQYAREAVGHALDAETAKPSRTHRHGGGCC